MDDGVELPGTSYDQLVRIVQGYRGSSVERKLSNSDVEKSTGVASSDVSRNGKFLIQIGILEGSKQKYLTEVGARLCKAYEFDLEGEIAEFWQSLIAETDFANKMLSAVRIRKGMDLRDFQTHVAYSAGSNKTNIKTGASTFVRLLEIANLISVQNGIVSVVSQTTRPSDGGVPEGRGSSNGTNGEFTPSADDLDKHTPAPPIQTVQESSSMQVQLRIVVNVQAEMNDLDRLPGIIKKLRDTVDGSTEGVDVQMGIEQASQQ